MLLDVCHIFFCNKKPRLSPGGLNWILVPELELIALLQYFGAFDFDVVVHRVACGLHEVCEKQATFLGLAVVAEYAVALVREAFRTLLEQVPAIAHFFFAVRK